MTVLARAAARLHVPVAVGTLWLLATSPWLAMRRSLPADAGWADLAHVGVGILAFVFGLAYAAGCLHGGSGRALYGWALGDLGPVGRDLAGLVRGRLPSSEGPGLHAAIAGLLLIALVFAGATGVGWLFVEGTAAALPWRAVHLVAADAVLWLLVAHVVAVALHMLDFVRR